MSADRHVDERDLVDVAVADLHPFGRRSNGVKVDCSTGDDAAVTIDRFKQAEDRDAAARNFEVQARPRAGGAVYTVGPFAVLILPATSDDNITSRLNTVLKKLSAN